MLFLQSSRFIQKQMYTGLLLSNPCYQSSILNRWAALNLFHYKARFSGDENNTTESNNRPNTMCKDSSRKALSLFPQGELAL